MLYDNDVREARTFFPSEARRLLVGERSSQGASEARTFLPSEAKRSNRARRLGLVSVARRGEAPSLH